MRAASSPPRFRHYSFPDPVMLNGSLPARLFSSVELPRDVRQGSLSRSKSFF